MILPALANEQAMFFFKRGEQRIQEENYQGAIEDLTKSLYIVDNNLDSYILRAIAKGKLGNHRAAIVDFKKCVGIARNQGNKERQAFCYSSSGLHKRYLEDYKGAVNDYKAAMPLYRELNDFARYKQMKQSISIYEDKIKETKTSVVEEFSAKKYMAMAKSDFAQRKYKAAIEKISQAIKIEPSNPFMYRMRAMAKVKLKDYKEALPDLYKTRDLYEQQSNFDSYDKTLVLIKKVQAKL